MKSPAWLTTVFARVIRLLDHSMHSLDWFFVAVPLLLVAGNLTIGSTYTMTLAGAYANNGATLNLTYSVSGLFGGTQRPVTLVGQDTALLSGATQQYFGFRDKNACATSNTLTVNYQNFTIAVPEPSTVAAATMGLGILLLVRTRRSGAARA